MASSAVEPGVVAACWSMHGVGGDAIRSRGAATAYGGLVSRTSHGGILSGCACEVDEWHGTERVSVAVSHSHGAEAQHTAGCKDFIRAETQVHNHENPGNPKLRYEINRVQPPLESSRSR